MNIKFEYCSRDAGNYKNFDFEIFSNKGHLSVDYISAIIKSALIDGEWFYTNHWKLRTLYSFEWDASIDHEWHEFSSIEETQENATKGDVHDFLKLIKQNTPV